MISESEREESERQSLAALERQKAERERRFLFDQAHTQAATSVGWRLKDLRKRKFIELGGGVHLSSCGASDRHHTGKTVPVLYSVKHDSSGNVEQDHHVVCDYSGPHRWCWIRGVLWAKEEVDRHLMFPSPYIEGTWSCTSLGARAAHNAYQRGIDSYKQLLDLIARNRKAHTES